MRTLPLTLALPLALALASAQAGCSGGGSSSGSDFVPAGPPSLVSVTGTAGAPGDSVTVTGLDFEASAAFEALFFGAVEATIEDATPSSIIARVPSGLAPGAASITLATRRGSAPTPLPFTVLAGPGGAPLVTSITPEAGPPGTQVVIAGTGFGPTPTANQVTLAGSAVAITAGTATQLTVTIPAGAKAGALVVTTPAGASSLARTFFLTSAARPANLGSVGDRNRDYVTAFPFTHLLIEVDLEGGVTSPQQAGLDDLRAELEARLRKPGGIRVIRDAAFPSQAPTTTTWTTVALAQVEATVRGHYDGPNCVVLHYTFVGRRFEQPNVIGLTYAGSSIAIFEERLVQSQGLGSHGRAVVEAAVEVHESGHTLGLVDLGTPMVNPHEDAAGGHDMSMNCVMFASLTTNAVGVQTDPPSHVFDAECILDLQELGGK